MKKRKKPKSQTSLWDSEMERDTARAKKRSPASLFVELAFGLGLDRRTIESKIFGRRIQWTWNIWNADFNLLVSRGMFYGASVKIEYSNGLLINKLDWTFILRLCLLCCTFFFLGKMLCKSCLMYGWKFLFLTIK